jgi:hypothetical protein
MFVLVWWQGGSTFAFYRLVGRVAMMMFSAHRLLAWSLSNGALALSTVVVRLLLCPVCVCMQCCMHWGAWLEPPRKLKQLVVATHERLLFRSSFGLPRTVLVTTDHQMNLHRVCRACLRLPPLSPRGNSWHLGRLAVRWFWPPKFMLRCGVVVGSFFWWACCRLERSTHWSNSQASGSFKTMPYPGLTILVIGWDKILKVKIMSIMLRLFLEELQKRNQGILGALLEYSCAVLHTFNVYWTTVC